MKKYTLFLSVLVLILLGFNTNSASAQMADINRGSLPAGCTSTSGFSLVTGLGCDGNLAFPLGCTSTRGYSPVTGVKCDRVIDPSLPPGCTSTRGYSPTTGVKCDSAVSPFPSGCTSNNGYSPITGRPCSTGYFPPGCSSSSGYSSTTGESCVISLSFVRPMKISDIKAITRVSPKTIANLYFGVREVSAQYNLGGYHQGTWYEGLNPGVSGPLWIEFGWPNSPDVEAIFLDQNNIEQKIYLPAVGTNNTNSDWFYWIDEDGSSYYAHSSHGPGWPDLNYKEALNQKHLARKAGTQTVISQPSITVLSPNGGENWRTNKVETIKWTTNNIPSSNNMTVRLRSIATGQELLNSNNPNIGYALISIPSSFVEGKYIAEVKTSVNGQSYMDASDDSFLITSTRPSITVLSPNGGENYDSQISTQIQVKWNMNYQPRSSVLIMIMVLDSFGVYGSQVVSEMANPTIGDNSFTVYSSTNWENGEKYKIRVCDRASTATTNPICDYSDNTFTITAPTASTKPSISSLSPITGPAGTVIRITGSGFGSSNTILFAGRTYSPYPTDGSTINFTVPSNIPSGSYGLSVVNSADLTKGENSNTISFTIKSPTAVLSCTDSDGGKNPNVAGATDDRVNGIGSYFQDKSVASNGGQCSGLSCTSVAEGYCTTDNKVANILTSCSTGYSISGACAVKPATPTTTVKPSITVLSPNGGETYKTGERINISWSATGVDRFNIYYCHTDLCATIATNVAGTSYPWTAPSTVEKYEIIVTKASDVVDSTYASDTSDSSFTITAPVSAIKKVINTGSLTASAIDATTSVSASFNFTQFLEEGSYGNEVRELQKFLNGAGYDSGIIDGIFGPKVKEALIKFQTANGLKGDGIVGYEVRSLLNK